MVKNLFIFSSEALDRYFAFTKTHWGTGSYYAGHYLIFLFAVLSIALLLIRFGPLLRPRWRHWAGAVLFVFVMRGILFGTPGAWKAYHGLFEDNELRRLLCYIESLKFERNYIRREIRYLAFGSSITQCLLFDIAKFDNKSVCFPGIYGLRPHEYIYLEGWIARLAPEKLLLYLTDYELTSVQPAERLDFMPFQGKNLWTIYRKARQYRIWENPGKFICRNIAGWLFPEYKYAVIFRRFKDRLEGKNFSLAPDLGPKLTPEEYLKAQFTMMSSPKAEKIDINLAFLEDFLVFLQKKNIEVILLEGQYNPLAYNSANRVTHRISVKKIRELAEKFPNARFIPAAKLTPLYPDDFMDVCHVKKEPAADFTKNLLGYLRDVPQKA